MPNLNIGPARVRGGRRGTRARVAQMRVAASKRAAHVGPPAGTAAALLAACGVGAAAEYFIFDRRHAALRRHMVRDRAVAVVRRRSRDGLKRARYLAGVAEGLAHKAAHASSGDGAQEQVDDLTLTQKVESVAFREAGVPKHHVNVNAEKGIVYLRGRLERDEQVDRLVRATHAIPGVKDVRSLVHTRSEGA